MYIPYEFLFPLRYKIISVSSFTVSLLPFLILSHWCSVAGLGLHLSRIALYTKYVHLSVFGLSFGISLWDSSMMMCVTVVHSYC